MAGLRASVFILVHKVDESRALALYPQLATAGFERARRPEAATAIVIVAGRGKVEKLPGIRGLEERARDPTFPLALVQFGKTYDGELPVFLEGRPLVDVLEPGGLERLVALLTGAAPEPGATIPLSPSMKEARRLASERHGEGVTPINFAEEIARIHPEYAGGLVETVWSRTIWSNVPAKPADAWLQEVRALVSPTVAPELHGRVVILCLSLLDPVLRDEFRDRGVEEALVDELREPLQELLTAHGLALWEERGEPTTTEEPVPAGPEETVPTHTDNPATVDELGREGLARVLARRIRDMRAQETAAAEAAGDEEHPRGRSFLVHLHAPWGMGKTSLLNFLRNELGPKSEDPWIVVEFNAWRHQRIAPPGGGS